jgi:hypothetical protein
VTEVFYIANLATDVRPRWVGLHGAFDTVIVSRVIVLALIFGRRHGGFLRGVDRRFKRHRSKLSLRVSEKDVLSVL